MDELQYSKKGQRHLTPFVGRESIYEYVMGVLDEERRVAFEELAKSDAELKKELARARAGLEYVGCLRETQISPALVEGIRTPSTYLHVLLVKMRFQEWPEGVKLLIEGVVIALGALVLILVLPWSRLFSLPKSFESVPVTLAKVTAPPSVDPDAETPAGAAPTKEILYEDEGAIAKPSPAPVVKPTASPAPVVKKTATEKPAPTPSPPAAVAVTKTVQKPETPPPPAAAPPPAAPAENDSFVPLKAGESAATEDGSPPADKVAAGISETAPDSGVKHGFLYRGSMSVANLEATAPKLAEFISSIGGRKAGDVELGWRKGTGAYFHFTIPEAKLGELSEELKEYGNLKLQKEPHPRVMPDGIVRLIITVGEKK